MLFIDAGNSMQFDSQVELCQESKAFPYSLLEQLFGQNFSKSL
jgi:hypothetical protein